MSVVCGLDMLISLHSAQSFIVPLAMLTAVVGEFFICSLISCHRSPSFKSWLSLVATSAIFTPSITISSTLSSSTGERPSCVSIWRSAQQQSTRWRETSFRALMMSLSFIFGGEFLSMSCFFSSHSPHVDLVMQITQRALYQPIGLGCLDRKQCRQIGNTMDIASYPQSSLQR